MTDIYLPGEQATKFITNTWRPEGFRKQDGLPVIKSESGLLVANAALTGNAFLFKEEWELLDKAIYRMQSAAYGALEDARAAPGVLKPTNLGVEVSSFKVASEKRRPSVNMLLGTNREEDRVDYKKYGVPLPIIADQYTINKRELLVARRNGVPLDTTEAFETAKAVMEEGERMLLNGEATVIVENSVVYGYTTHPGRETGTAASYGGGDFATITNPRSTFEGVLAAMAAKRYHGPWRVYLANTQYHQLLARYADGSGETVLEDLLSMPKIASIDVNDFLADGVMVWVQLTENVVDLQEALPLTNRRWEDPDGSQLHYVVMWSITPRIKYDYAGNVGVVHVTAC